MSCLTKNNYACNSTSSTAQYCCFNGDTCVGHSICYFTHPWAEANGYYIGGCTNPNYPGPSCSKQCGHHPTQDIVYDSITNLWACCYGSGRLNCSYPTNETFEAASPEQLMASLGSLSSSSTRISTSSSSSSSSPTVLTSMSSVTTSSTTSAAATRILTVVQPSPNTTLPANKSSDSNPGSDLSSSASASTSTGIGVGSTFVGLGLLALTFYLIRRARHSKSTSDNGRPNLDNSSRAPQIALDPSFLPTQKTVELDAEDKHLELDSRTFVELHSGVRKGGSGR